MNGKMFKIENKKRKEIVFKIKYFIYFKILFILMKKYTD